MGVDPARSLTPKQMIVRGAISSEIVSKSLCLRLLPQPAPKSLCRYEINSVDFG